MAVNDSASPQARAAGPHLCSEIAAPNTIGMSGRTHGERIENSPAISASGMLNSSMGYNACRTKVSIASGLVAPEERATSLPPR
jgi:hypothetical protein